MGWGRKSSYLAAFSIFFHGSRKKFNQLAKKKKKKLLKTFLCSRKTKVAIKFLTIFLFCSFLTENWVVTERVKSDLFIVLKDDLKSHSILIYYCGIFN